ncbi:hypothetical protein DFA_12013 [Cavenderia fasciculata]|uniref:NGG1p interacting factor NIF3 n=1 Tax=Cavenderia fasciculata TaxID=261658 RepID=F4QF89_CACFS|nr:uncharacterized protein DFA_12013 [Cavenderia fasciculata]EGG14243.1 hypothetical protein DFA_12013 [Cavenderia fasciculata]|eukprot:XP_004350952.1 hypothetical protein DFA_12013 [Cavenderia fasciculata]
MYKLCFFVPETHLLTVKKALFAMGAGKIGNYDSCCFEFKGQGQFRALPGATPFIGKENIIEVVEEYKVEMVVEDSLIKHAVQTLKLSHPYETVAYDVIKLEEF